MSRRELSLLVDADELARRARAQGLEPPTAERGYLKLFLDSVTQAEEGVDFDFLRAVTTRETVPRSR